jgi:erythromycin esterase
LKLARTAIALDVAVSRCRRSNNMEIGDMTRLWSWKTLPDSARRTALIAAVLTAAAIGTSSPPTVLAHDTDDPWLKLAESIREYIHPLRDAGNLDPIIEFVGDRRAALLGEASHGTEEFYHWRAEITKRLITEKGFNFVAVEGDWGAAMAVNRYVKHLDGAPENARAAVESFTRWPTWLWNNQVTMEFVQWLHEHNADLPPERRVGFYGIDVYGVNDSLEKAVRYVRRLDADAADQIVEAYDCFRPYAGEAEAIRGYFMLLRQGRSCEQELGSVVNLLRENREPWAERDRRAYFHAKQNALVVRNAERHFRLMMQQDHQSWNARAEHFHLTFARLLDLYGPSSRGIVWAHNTHVGDAAGSNMAMLQQTNIGRLAREALGRENVAIVGFSTNHGTVVAGPQGNGPRLVMDVDPPPRFALEELMMLASDEPFLFIVDDVRDLPGIEHSRGHRAIGVVFDPRQVLRNYVPTVLPERYDAFIFIPETTALREVEKPDDSASNDDAS